ncbi:ABC transporter substrate-binding protein [Patescibacteria group bacterium]
MNFFKQLLFALHTFWLGITPILGEYTEGMLGQPRSFLPSQIETKADITVSRLIYRGLFKYDIYGTLVPDLAETWGISEDGLVYTIKLKNDQYWSNGEKITSDDLIYTAFKVSNLAGVATDRVDEQTVRYTLPNKYSPFLHLLTVGVMPVDAEVNNNPLKPVSSGPFTVVRIEKSGPVIKQVYLLHEDTDQNIRRLAFRYYANEEELITAAKLGEINGFVSNKEHELDNFTKHEFPLQGVYYSLFFNLREEKLQDVELRKSLAHSLPMEQLIFGNGISVQGAISRNNFTDRSLDFDIFDEEVSTEYPNTVLRITVPDIKVHKKLAENIAHIWEDKFGMEVKIIEMDPDKIFDEVIKERSFEVLLYGQEVGRDPDRYINWHSTQKDYPGLNLTGFEQVRADQALEFGRNESTSEKRVEHYNQFQKVVQDEVPAIFLYHPFSKYYVSNFVTGIGEKYTFTTGDRFLDFNNWKKLRTN